MRSSFHPSPALRTGGLLAASAALAFGLSSCASTAVSLDYVPPTMAPEQSIDEACKIAGDEVDRITLEVEAQIKSGIDEARVQLAAGRLPSLDFFSGTVDDALAEVHEQVENAEVAQAVSDIRASLQAFGEIDTPDSPLAVAGYLSDLTTELNNLVSAGKDLQELCGIGATS
ncbi:MAG: hypothetical protein GX862_10035 [Leucobacter sp.]|nr:hypothetical protein [Leucobacter sp.]